MAGKQYQDEDGYTYERRPRGRRVYVDSPKLTKLRALRDELSAEVDGFYDEIMSYDELDAADCPDDLHSSHIAYMDTRSKLTGVEAAIVREQWYLMAKGSEYGYLNDDGERVRYDMYPVPPYEDPKDVVDYVEDLGDRAEVEADDEAATVEDTPLPETAVLTCDSKHGRHIRFGGLIDAAASCATAYRDGYVDGLADVSDLIDGMIEDTADDDEACTDEEED